MATKRILDVIATLTLLAVTMPLWIIAAILIRLTDSGPIFFAQERIGHRGRPFRIFKFRTMRSDASPYAPSPTHDHDPRITPIGRVLRTAGLDELPQLINVLLGNMSLVGPRPEMPFIVQDYTPLERQRLLAKPGITGLWQLSADRHDAIHVNLEYDLYYLRHQSLLLDCLILLETVIFTVEVIGRRLASAAGGVLDRLGFPTRSPSPAPSDPDGHGARFTAANEIRRGAHEADQDRKPQPIQIPLRLGSVSPPDRVMEHPPQRKWRRSKR